jgi:hypothetical protein
LIGRELASRYDLIGSGFFLSQDAARVPLHMAETKPDLLKMATVHGLIAGWGWEGASLASLSP